MKNLSILLTLTLTLSSFFFGCAERNSESKATTQQTSTSTEQEGPKKIRTEDELLSERIDFYSMQTSSFDQAVSIITSEKYDLTQHANFNFAFAITRDDINESKKLMQLLVKRKDYKIPLLKNQYAYSNYIKVFSPELIRDDVLNDPETIHLLIQGTVSEARSDLMARFIELKNFDPTRLITFDKSEKTYLQYACENYYLHDFDHTDYSFETLKTESLKIISMLAAIPSMNVNHVATFNDGTPSMSVLNNAVVSSKSEVIEVLLDARKPFISNPQLAKYSKFESDLDPESDTWSTMDRHLRLGLSGNFKVYKEKLSESIKIKFLILNYYLLLKQAKDSE